MFGVMRIINLAHGSLAVRRRPIARGRAGRHGSASPPSSALLIVLPAMALIGWALQRLVLERSLRAGALLPILTTFGLADRDRQPAVRAVRRRHALARALHRHALLRQLRAARPAHRRPAVRAHLRASPCCCSAGCSCMLELHRRSGARIRAIAEDPDTAELVGINATAGERRRRRRSRSSPWRVAGAFLGDARDLRPLFRRAATDLRLRGGGHRRRRLALGHAASAASSSASRRASAPRSVPEGFLIAGHVRSLP